MNNKALKQYIENKYGVKVVEIKNRKIGEKLYIVCTEESLDMWSSCYRLYRREVFDNLSDIVDTLEYGEKLSNAKEVEENDGNAGE